MTANVEQQATPGYPRSDPPSPCSLLSSAPCSPSSPSSHKWVALVPTRSPRSWPLSLLPTCASFAFHQRSLLFPAPPLSPPVFFTSLPPFSPCNHKTQTPPCFPSGSVSPLPVRPAPPSPLSCCAAPLQQAYPASGRTAAHSSLSASPTSRTSPPPCCRSSRRDGTLNSKGKPLVITQGVCSKTCATS